MGKSGRSSLLASSMYKLSLLISIAFLLAKSYKRPTKKEKLGLSASSNSKGTGTGKSIQRHTPISAQFSNSTGFRTKGEREFEDYSSISQAAGKLLLEAEKKEFNGHNTQIDDTEDEIGMKLEGLGKENVKRKAGASGMKAKAKKRGNNQENEGAKQLDYVDLL